MFEQEITVDLPAATQILSPRLFLDTGATAVACAGVDVRTGLRSSTLKAMQA